MAYSPIVNPMPVTGTFFQTTQPVSGTVTASISGSVGVTGTFFQVTQPVSAASLPLPSGAATSAKQPALGTAGTASADVITVQGIASGTAQPVSIATMPSTPVTGTFWQATQPVSGTVGVSGSVAVTGTFFQATQPVSIATMPSTPVTGTFWQTTQPVSAASLPLPTGAAADATLTGGTQRTKVTDGTNNAAVKAASTAAGATDPALVVAISPNNTVAVSIASMPSTPVTGTFWQATQPVSGTVSISGSVAVTGTFFQATQPVSLATNTPVIATGANVIGSLVANQSVNNAQIGGVAVATGSGVTGTGVQRVTLATDVALPSGTNTLGTTTGPALTKATQGSTGYSVQDLKDSGRAIVNAVTAIAGVTAVTTEALVALNVSRDGAATSSLTTIPITSGKRYRVQQIVVGIISTSAAVISGRFSLRMNPSGVVTATSTIIGTLAVPSGAALAQAGGSMIMDIPDGIEFSGTMQIGISQVCSVATGTIWVSVIGYEY